MRHGMYIEHRSEHSVHMCPYAEPWDSMKEALNTVTKFAEMTMLYANACVAVSVVAFDFTDERVFTAHEIVIHQRFQESVVGRGD